MTDRSAEPAQVWFPDDQHGYSIAICVCEGGAYLGARQMGTPCCCERCGRLTREQWDFLVETISTPPEPVRHSHDWHTYDDCPELQHCATKGCGVERPTPPDMTDEDS